MFLFPAHVQPHIGKHEVKEPYMSRLIVLNRQASNVFLLFGLLVSTG